MSICRSGVCKQPENCAQKSKWRYVPLPGADDDTDGVRSLATDLPKSICGANGYFQHLESDESARVLFAGRVAFQWGVSLAALRRPLRTHPDMTETGQVPLRISRGTEPLSRFDLAVVAVE